MKKVLAVVGVALAASVGVNAYQAVPSGGPSKPAYVQRVEELWKAVAAADYKTVCDAAPTATLNYGEFLTYAAMQGIQDFPGLRQFCQAIVKDGTTDDQGKPLPVKWEVLWWTAPEKAAEGSVATVIAKVQFGDRQPQTWVLKVELARVQWVTGLDAKCVQTGVKQKVTCPSLRWYVITAG